MAVQLGIGDAELLETKLPAPALIRDASCNASGCVPGLFMTAIIE